MNDCEEIEKKAYQHLLRCTIDDSIIWANEVKTAFTEVTEQFMKIGDVV